MDNKGNQSMLASGNLLVASPAATSPSRTGPDIAAHFPELGIAFPMPKHPGEICAGDDRFNPFRLRELRI
jgi:hypothetical protein